MTLEVFTACFYPSEQPIWRLAESCKRFGIKLTPYGIGEPYQSWRTMKLTKLIPMVEQSKADVVMYTDGADSWFIRGQQDIEYFNEWNDPVFGVVVIAPEQYCWPIPELAKHFAVGRCPCAGQFMGPRQTVLDTLRYLEAMTVDREPENDQTRWHYAMANGQISAVVDSGLVFGDPENTPSRYPLPCVLHFNGGGDKEARMAPWWQKTMGGQCTARP